MNEGDEGNRLDRLTTGRGDRPAVRGRSRVVGALKIFLPLTALVIFSLAMTWNNLKDNGAPIPKDMILPDVNNAQNELIRPRFESTDENQLPFVVTAARAIQNLADQEKIELEAPVADLTLENGDWLSAEGLTGFYSQMGRSLQIDGQVKLFYSQGYELQTEKMDVDLQSKLITMPQAVRVLGPAGTIDATAAHVEGGRGKIVFTGPAKAVLHRTLSKPDQNQDQQEGQP